MVYPRETGLDGRPGVTIAGRYRVVGRLGSGGAGVVWRAEDTLLRRPVAIKELHPPEGTGQSELDELRAGMLREARAAARLDHPGAVTVFDVLNEGDRDYIVMQLIDGPNLAEVVTRTGPLTAHAAADLGLQLLDVLEAAHLQGLIHRDVKPANVMFATSSRAKLADFGIARFLDDPTITAPGLVRGTPQYMSPEQAVGQGAGPAADLWGVGATLYYAVEGRPPFDRGQALATLTSITVDPPRPSQRAGPLDEVLRALMVKDPASRPGDTDVRRRLRAVADSGAPTHEILLPGAWSPAVSAADPAVDAPVAEGPPRVSAPPDEAPAPAEEAAAAVPAAEGAAAPAEEAAPPTGTAVPDMAPMEATAVPSDLSRTGGDRPIPARRHRAWKWAATGVLVAGLVAGILVASNGNSPRRAPPRAAPAPAAAGQSGSHPAAASPTTTGNGSTPVTTAPAAVAESSSAHVPATWASYTDPQTGFGFRYPTGWHVSQQGTHTTFTDPTSGAYVLIDHQTPPAATAQGPWYQLEPSFRLSHPGYERIGITPTTFKGNEAAVWEYTYNDGATRLHAIDLGMIVGSHGYAFNAQTTDAGWAAFQPELAQLEAGFTPAP